MKKTIIAAAVAAVSVSALPFTTSAIAKGAAAGATVPAPPAGKGQVVFFRPGSLMGAAIRCTVRENGKLVTRLSNGKYMVVPLDTGAHRFTTKTEATDTLNLEVEAGQTQYVRCKIGMGVMAGRSNLSPAQESEFAAKAAKLKPVDAADLAEDQAQEAARSN